MATTIQSMAVSGYIGADDVLTLRREFYRDGDINQQEALAIWQLADQSPQGDPQWPTFFVEALTTYFVDQSHPKGYVDEAQATSIIERLNGQPSTITPMAFDLLVQIMAKSTSVPSKLASFALEAIRQTVLNGHGPTAHGHSAPGVITKSDVIYIRKTLYAAASEDHLGISRREAELLFDLNDATIEAQNDPEWSDLFTKAIACYLMAHMGYSPPSREDALRRSAWLDDTSINIGGFLSTMGKSGFVGFAGLFRKTPPPIDQDMVRQAAISQAEEITQEEAGWLAKRIAHDGRLHANEIALIEYMKTLGAELPKSLTARIAELEIVD